MALIRNTERDLMIQLGIFKRDIFEDACVISPCLFPFAVPEIHRFAIAAAELKLAALIPSVATHFNRCPRIYALDCACSEPRAQQVGGSLKGHGAAAEQISLATPRATAPWGQTR